MKKIKRVPALTLLLVFMIALITACSPVNTDTQGSPSPGSVTGALPGPGNTSGDGVTRASGSASSKDPDTGGKAPSGLAGIEVEKDGHYTSRIEVAAYIHQFGELPSNFITKEEARRAGWVAERGNLWEVAEGMSIGGDRFGNFEKLLPEARGRQYYECDIDYEGGRRGAKRIIFSNDGLIFYTDDHYASFERLE